MSAPLTAASLAALQREQAEADAPDGEQYAVRALLDQEASIARREHVSALLREYHELQQLSPAEAAGWQQRRETASARRIQSAWRRRSSRRHFLQVIHHSQVHRRAKAATTIQRAQRDRQHVVAEAAPPITKDQLDAIQKEVIEKTLALAKELREARDKREEWRSAQKEAMKDAAGNPEKETTPPPRLPAWLEDPEWARDMERQKPGGSAVVHALRNSARRGLHFAPGVMDPQLEMIRQIKEWPQLRADMQKAAVRRQVARTQAAALHAQLRFPPPLPTVPRAPEGASSLTPAQELALPPVLPSKPSVLAAHRRLLQQERLKLEMEEQEQAAIASGELDKAAALLTPRHGMGGGEGGGPLSPGARDRGSEIAKAWEGRGQVLSSAELIWLASLERPTLIQEAEDKVMADNNEIYSVSPDAELGDISNSVTWRGDTK